MGRVEILLLMAILDVVRDVVDLGECTMEILMVHIVDNTIQPCTVVFLPVLAAFQIVHESLMRLIEVGVAAVHLRIKDALEQDLLLLLWLLLIECRRFLPGSKRRAYNQHNHPTDNPFHIYTKCFCHDNVSLSLTRFMKDTAKI